MVYLLQGFIPKVRPIVMEWGEKCTVDNMPPILEAVTGITPVWYAVYQYVKDIADYEPLPVNVGVTRDSERSYYKRLAELTDETFEEMEYDEAALEKTKTGSSHSSGPSTSAGISTSAQVRAAAEQLAVSQATKDALANIGNKESEEAVRDLERLRVSPSQDTTKRSEVEATLPTPLQPPPVMQQKVEQFQADLERIRTRARDQELFGSDTDDDEPTDIAKDVHMLEDEPYDPAEVRPRAEEEREDSHSPTPPPPGTEPPGNVPQGDGHEEDDELNSSSSSESSETSTSSSGSSSSSSSSSTLEEK
jgi:hypothetical protein